MSNDTVNLTVTREQAQAIEGILSLLVPAEAPARVVDEATCGVATKAGTPCSNRKGACRWHGSEAKAEVKAPTAPTGKKGGKKGTKAVQVEVTAGNRVTKASIKRLRELGVTATGKRSLEVVERRAKVAGLTIEPVPYGTLS